MKWLTVMVTLLVPAGALADPCGMVPPVYTGPGAETGPAIVRTGDQMTYAFFKDGIETFVIRPSFTGKVDNFGMLIPFPSPPAIRKVPDNLFTHIKASIDPPQLILDFTPPPPRRYSRRSAKSKSGGMPMPKPSAPKKDEVRVLRQEAVGMYEIAVLEAGSAGALKKWMDQNGYKYPKGMDEPVNDYVADGWPFVAVKTRVGHKGATRPRPGMKKVAPDRPAGSQFDGNVQAMGFRFKTPKPVIPMRLSAFNEGKMRNLVYLLTDRPSRVKELSTQMVVRQVTGGQLYLNVSKPIRLRIIKGTIDNISRRDFADINDERDPAQYNGLARELYASDLMALRRKTLALPFEEKEKALLRVSEALNLRGTAIDGMHHRALETEKKQTLSKVLPSLKGMHLTVIDGDFPRETIAEKNLTFASFRIPEKRNSRLVYDARFGEAGDGRRGELQPRGTRPSAEAKSLRYWDYWIE